MTFKIQFYLLPTDGQDRKSDTTSLIYIHKKALMWCIGHDSNGKNKHMIKDSKPSLV